MMPHCFIERALPWILLAVALNNGCGGGGSSSSPSPSSPSPAPAAPVNVAGTWTGTLESSNFAPRAISLDVVQGGSCVDGAWTTSPSEWDGAISGFADTASFSGTMSIERSADKCTGIATVSGEVGTDTLRWTSTGFTGNCSAGLPQSVIVTLTRH
jgi:hypothetical protein